MRCFLDIAENIVFVDCDSADLGCFLNAYVLLPAYAKAFQMPMDALVGMGTAVNSHITSVTTLVIFAIVPFNLLKGVLVSLIVFLIYTKISPIFHMGR